MYSAYKLNKHSDSIQPWRTPFPIWNQSVVPCPVLTVASWPAYRFLKRQVRWSGIPISQNFPKFIVIHTINGFGVVNKAEIDIFLELSCFFNDPADVGNLTSGSSAFYKTSLNIWKFTVHVLLKPGLENFEHYSASMWNECSCVVVWAFFGIEFKGMKKVGGGVLRQKEWVTAYVFDSWISSSAQSNVSQRKSFVCVEGWRRGEVVFFSFLKYNWFAMLCYFQGFS